MAIMTVGIGLFTQISPDGSYVTDLLPGLLVIGLGMPFAYVAISIGGADGRAAGGRGARVGAHQHDAADRRRSRHRHSLGDRDVDDVERGRRRHGMPVAMTDGFRTAFWVGTGIAALGLLASLVLVRSSDTVPQVATAPAS
jgi:hypothetical protein